MDDPLLISPPWTTRSVARPSWRLTGHQAVAFSHQAATQTPRPVANPVALSFQYEASVPRTRLRHCCAWTELFGVRKLDAVIDQAIREDRIPGAVLIVGHNGEIVHQKAYGRRALVPRPEPMTVDTIFDCASLTKLSRPLRR